MRSAGIWLLLILTASPAVADLWDSLDELYDSGRFEAATALLERADSEEARPACRVFYWRYLLATDPVEAAAALAELRASPDPEIPGLLDRLRSDRAWLHFAGLEPDSALALLAPPVADDVETPPSPDPFLHGLCLKTLGHTEAARTQFARNPVDPTDAGWQRLQLARLAFAEDRPQEAQRQLEATLDAGDGCCRPNALALLWRLLASNDPKRAKSIEQELSDRHRGSFAQGTVSVAARERERLRTMLQTEIISLPSDATRLDEPDLPPGAYTLSLAEFLDRGPALAFRETWGDILPGIAILTRTDERGRPVYEVRGGRYPNRPRAVLQAERLSREHGLDCRVLSVADGS